MPENAPPPEDRPESELEQSMHHLGKTLGGVMGRLFGEKATGIKVDPETPVLGKDGDEALEVLGQEMGRWLRAAGEGLRQHPTAPGKAVEVMKEVSAAEVEVEEGSSPLSQGLRTFASGLYRSTEAVLDKVAPRRPKPEEEAEAGKEAEVGEE